VHREGNLAEVLAGSQDPPIPERRLGHGCETRDQHVETVAGLTFPDEHGARRHLVSLHPVGELPEGFSRERGEQPNARELGDRGGDVSRRHSGYGTRVGVLTGWRFCPLCASPVAHGYEQVQCLECGFVSYANPAPSASALVVPDGGGLLLVRRADEPFEGLWDFPGGYVHESEHPLDALQRELFEETGLGIEPLHLFGIWMDQYGPEPDAPWTMNMYWTVRPLGGELRPADDVTELRWFSPEELPPPDETAFRHVPDVLTAWVESVRPRAPKGR
jgi:8-oxo-dGTP diphosphatase